MKQYSGIITGLTALFLAGVNTNVYACPSEMELKEGGNMYSGVCCQEPRTMIEWREKGKDWSGGKEDNACNLVYSPVCAKKCEYEKEYDEKNGGYEGKDEHKAGDSRFCRLITFANECYAKEAEADILYGGQCEGREDLRRPWEDLPCYVEKYGKNWRQIISKYEGNLR